MDPRSELVANFGESKVSSVEDLVNIADPVFAYVSLKDEGDEEACEIIETLYFERA